MNSMDSVIVKNPEILGGMPVFRGTRVPIQNLFDYLEGGETLEEFLEGFPTVSREAALDALEEAKHLLLARSYLLNAHLDRRVYRREITQSFARPGLPNCPLRWVGRPEEWRPPDSRKAPNSMPFSPWIKASNTSKI
jgi:uncharacterized protein (DUF433 family)